jgi:hypothetical protein
MLDDPNKRTGNLGPFLDETWTALTNNMPPRSLLMGKQTRHRSAISVDITTTTGSFLAVIMVLSPRTESIVAWSSLCHGYKGVKNSV